MSAPLVNAEGLAFELRAIRDVEVPVLLGTTVRRLRRRSLGFEGDTIWSDECAVAGLEAALSRGDLEATGATRDPFCFVGLVGVATDSIDVKLASGLTLRVPAGERLRSEEVLRSTWGLLVRGGLLVAEGA